MHFNSTMLHLDVTQFTGIWYCYRYTVQTFKSCTSRLDVCKCMVAQTSMTNMSKDMPSTLMTHVACKSKLSSVVRSSMHPCPGNWVAIGSTDVYYARAAHAFSAVIKCRYCRYLLCYIGMKCQDILYTSMQCFCTPWSWYITHVFSDLLHFFNPCPFLMRCCLWLYILQQLCDAFRDSKYNERILAHTADINQTKEKCMVSLFRDYNTCL